MIALVKAIFGEGELADLANEVVAKNSAAHKDSAFDSLHQFHEKHGLRCAYYAPWFIYEDGARRHALTGELIEPPQHEGLLNELRSMYVFKMYVHKTTHTVHGRDQCHEGTLRNQ